MEQYPSSMNNEPTNPTRPPANSSAGEVGREPNRLHNLAFLKVGLFEIGFVAIVLLLLFGTLNYFNILPVSDAFPQLGFLPRQQSKLSSQDQALQSQSKNVIPSPTNFTPNTFNYDTEKAKTLLTQYLKDTIKPEFLPSKIEVKQGQLTINSQNIPYLFTSSFAINGTTVSTNLYFNENTNNPDVLVTFINLKDATQEAPTVSLANSLLSSFFANPYLTSSCKNEDYISYCENLKTVSDGKKGYGIFKSTTSTTFSLISCFISNGSKYYELESCTKL